MLPHGLSSTQVSEAADLAESWIHGRIASDARDKTLRVVGTLSLAETQRRFDTRHLLPVLSGEGPCSKCVWDGLRKQRLEYEAAGKSTLEVLSGLAASMALGRKYASMD